jgi:hypothetical protein
VLCGEIHNLTHSHHVSGLKHLAGDKLVLRTRFEGANPRPEIRGLDPLPGKTNYLTRRSAAEWITGVDLFARVAYRSVYPGIDLIYYTRDGRLEHDFVVAPGADPSRIRFSFEGARKIELEAGR